MKSLGVYEDSWRNHLNGGSQTVRGLVLDRATMEVKKEMGDKLAPGCIRGQMVPPSARGDPGIRNLYPGICNRRS